MINRTHAWAQYRAARWLAQSRDHEWSRLEREAEAGSIGPETAHRARLRRDAARAALARATAALAEVEARS